MRRRMINTWTVELLSELSPGLPLNLALLLRLLSAVTRLATTVTNNTSKVTLWPLMLPCVTMMSIC